MKHWFSLKMWYLMTLALPVNSHILLGNAGIDWTYDGEKGPDHWHLDFPHCGGRSQSPVNIQTAKVIVDHRKLAPFQMKGYDSAGDLQIDLENNGHTIQINLQGKGMSITGGGLSNVYIANQFHFHWGKTDKRGSEHAIDGKYFPMEMHVVHYNLMHKNFSQAVNKKDGLAVLSFFFKVGKHNVNLDPVIKRFPEIPHRDYTALPNARFAPFRKVPAPLGYFHFLKFRDDHTTIKKLFLRKLLPKKLNGYFRYHGSLTTPPCYESVKWSIFYDPINISEKQLQSFRNKVHQNFANETNRDISDDYRPLQSLNQRKIYCSKEFD